MNNNVESPPELTPETESIPEKGEELETEEKLEKMTEKEREKIGLGFNNMGYYVEERKNSFFSKVFKNASERCDKNSTMERWLRSFSENYTKDAEKSEKKIKQIEEGKKNKFGNVASLTGNILRYGRVVTDIIGYTAGSPFRYVMMGGMFFSRGTEAAKEARLKNEEVIEKTRVNDIDEAFEQAQKIYEQAQEEAIENNQEKVSVEDLKKAYQQNIPEDLLKRLGKEGEPGITSGILQKIIKWDVMKSVERIEEKLYDIQFDDESTDREWLRKEEKIFNKYSKHLDELDAIVGQYGTVDAMAMGARYGETAAKTIVKAMMVETASLAIYSLWHELPNIYSKMSEFMSSSDGSGKPETYKFQPRTISRIKGIESVEPDVAKEDITKEALPLETPSEVLKKGLEANFTLELGKGEAPSQLEKVFLMMTVDHMDNITDSKSMFTEEQGAKSLNMAANLVRLSEGKDTIGIKAEDFAKIVSYDVKVNSLKIIDHEQFNQIVDKLENHSDELWDKNVLQKGALTELHNIKKSSWLKIIHAEGMDKIGDIETGISGHDEIKLEQITDFDKSEMVQEVEVEKTTEKTTETIKEAIAKEPVTEILATAEDSVIIKGNTLSVFNKEIGKAINLEIPKGVKIEDMGDDYNKLYVKVQYGDHRLYTDLFFNDKGELMFEGVPISGFRGGTLQETIEYLKEPIVETEREIVKEEPIMKSEPEVVKEEVVAEEGLSSEVIKRNAEIESLLKKNDGIDMVINQLKTGEIKPVEFANFYIRNIKIPSEATLSPELYQKMKTTIENLNSSNGLEKIKANRALTIMLQRILAK